MHNIKNYYVDEKVEELCSNFMYKKESVSFATYRYDKDGNQYRKTDCLREINAALKIGMVEDVNKVVGLLWLTALSKTEKLPNEELQKWIDLATKVAKGSTLNKLDQYGWLQSVKHKLNGVNLKKWNDLAEKEWLKKEFFECMFTQGRVDLVDLAKKYNIDLNENHQQHLPFIATENDFIDLLMNRGWDPLKYSVDGDIIISNLEKMSEGAAGSQSLDVIKKVLVSKEPSKKYFIECEILKGRSRRAWDGGMRSSVWDSAKEAMVEIEKNSNLRPHRCFYESDYGVPPPAVLMGKLIKKPLDLEIPFLLDACRRQKLGEDDIICLIQRRKKWTPMEWAAEAFCCLMSVKNKDGVVGEMTFIMNETSDSHANAFAKLWLAQIEKCDKWKTKMDWYAKYYPKELANVESYVQRTMLNQGAAVNIRQRKSRIAL